MKPAPIDMIESNRRYETEPKQVSLPNKYENLTIIAAKPKLSKSKPTNKQEMLKKIVEIFEPIRTRVANW
jgi:hypothetical protein